MNDTLDVLEGDVLVRDGRIAAVGEAADLLGKLGAAPVDDWRPHLVMPGFVDAHIHFPQARVIASYGTQLLDWLNRYTFVEEARFADPAHAAAEACRFPPLPEPRGHRKEARSALPRSTTARPRP